MKKNILNIFLAWAFISGSYLNAQVTIGSAGTPAKGALLDLKQEDKTDGSSNSSKGLLLPRVLLSTTKPTAGKLSESIGNTGTWNEDTHIGLMVYSAKNTIDACTGGAYEGVYTWTGTEWLPIYKKTLTAPELEVNSDEFEGANSYIVKTNSTINIPVNRAYSIWNAYTGSSISTGKVLSTTDANFGGAETAKIVWQDSGTINSVSISGSGALANLVVNTGTSEGNALVSVLLDDKVLWQWHIWVLNINPLENANMYVMNGEINWYMSHLLGAKTTTGVGLYYQWGRNVPLQKIGDTELISSTASEKDNLTNAIQSEKFLVYQSTASHDWYSSTPKAWDSRWGDRNNDATAKKSPFDPCPQGWRAPSAMAGKSPWECIDKSENLQNMGAVYTGYRANGDSSVGDVGLAGYVWTASANERMAEILYYGAGGVLGLNAFNRANGLNVRCLKEK